MTTLNAEVIDAMMWRAGQTRNWAWDNKWPANVREFFDGDVPAIFAELVQLRKRLETAQREADTWWKRSETQVDIIADLERKIEDRRMRLVAAESDLLNIRGVLSPNGGAHRVPMELVPEVAPAIEWLVAELERVTNLARANEEAHRAEIRQIVTDHEAEIEQLKRYQVGIPVFGEVETCADHNCPRVLCECDPAVTS